MSIWCSQDHIGTESVYEAQGGQVLTYAEGFSNHHPDLTGSHERPATVDIAYAPSWCVPGHRDAEEPVCECGETHDAYAEVSPWVRLTLAAEESLSWWGPDKPKVEPLCASVVMDEAAARELARQLLEWADSPHLAPAAAPAPDQPSAVDAQSETEREDA